MTYVDALERASRGLRAWLIMHPVCGFPRARVTALLAREYIDKGELSPAALDAFLLEQSRRHIERVEARIEREERID